MDSPTHSSDYGMSKAAPRNRALRGAGSDARLMGAHALSQSELYELPPAVTDRRTLSRNMRRYAVWTGGRSQHPSGGVCYRRTWAVREIRRLRGKPLEVCRKKPIGRGAGEVM